MSKSRQIYSGRIIDLTVERVTLPHGVTAELEIVHHPGGAAVVAVNTEEQVCLVRQYRHAVAAWLWELPAGKLDGKEQPLLAAKRELREETGATAARWEPLGELISSPGVFNERIHLFLATDLIMGAPAPDPEEHLEIAWIDLATALDQALSAELNDAKTLAGLVRAARRLARAGGIGSAQNTSAAP